MQIVYWNHQSGNVLNARCQPCDRARSDLLTTEIACYWRIPMPCTRNCLHNHRNETIEAHPILSHHSGRQYISLRVPTHPALSTSLPAIPPPSPEYVPPCYPSPLPRRGRQLLVDVYNPAWDSTVVLHHVSPTRRLPAHCFRYKSQSMQTNTVWSIPHTVEHWEKTNISSYIALYPVRWQWMERRFNKISIQGIPDKEAISLSRVHIRLYKIFVYSVLEDIDTTSMHTIIW